MSVRGARKERSERKHSPQRCYYYIQLWSIMGGKVSKIAFVRIASHRIQLLSLQWKQCTFTVSCFLQGFASLSLPFCLAVKIMRKQTQPFRDRTKNGNRVCCSVRGKFLQKPLCSYLLAFISLFRIQCWRNWYNSRMSSASVFPLLEIRTNQNKFFSCWFLIDHQEIFCLLSTQ